MKRLFSSILLSVAVNAGYSAQLFYTDIVEISGTRAVLKRSNVDGSGTTNIVSGLLHPRSVAVDTFNEKVYWIEHGVSAIRRANFDGTAVQVAVQTSDSDGGFALDVQGGKLYWTSAKPTPAVMRANLDGSNVETLVTAGLIAPAAVAIDPLHQKLYWTDLHGHLDGAGTIQRSNMDGTQVENLLSGIDYAGGLAIDPVGAKIYWTEAASDRIQRSDLDGKGVEDLVTGLNGPTTLTLDLHAKKIYWTDSDWLKGTPRILKSNLDGSGVQEVSSGGFPWGIALQSGPSVDLIKAVRPAFSGLAAGVSYQLQLSGDLKNWTNYGGPFVPTNSFYAYPNYWHVTDWNSLHFRLTSPQ